MSNTSLPARPSLEQLKNRAKELLIAVRSNDRDAVELFARHHPVRRLENERFALHDAQLVLARQHGFPNWTQLKEEVERRASDFSQRADRFVLDAVDGDFERALRTLDFEPELARANLWPALAVGDVPFLRRALERDPGCADRRGGPCKGWTPLLYISFSRFQMENDESQARFTECARLLLDGGAEPNAAFADSRPRKPRTPCHLSKRKTTSRSMRPPSAEMSKQFEPFWIAVSILPSKAAAVGDRRHFISRHGSARPRWSSSCFQGDRPSTFQPVRQWKASRSAGRLTVRPIAAIQRETIRKSCAHCSQPERILHLIRLRWRVRRWPRLSTPRGQERTTENRPK